MRIHRTIDAYVQVYAVGDDMKVRVAICKVEDAPYLDLLHETFLEDLRCRTKGEQGSLVGKWMHYPVSISEACAA